MAIKKPTAAALPIALLMLNPKNFKTGTFIIAPPIPIGAEIKPEINIEIISENKSVTFLIEDNGMGISKELMGRIFEPYVTSKSTGTGLGLAIVNKIIEEHSGKIDIKRNKSKGISVSVRLPKQ